MQVGEGYRAEWRIILRFKPFSVIRVRVHFGIMKDFPRKIESFGLALHFYLYIFLKFFREAWKVTKSYEMIHYEDCR